ncbi:unnamed protein product [Ectocarpus fasciculatus]
MATTEGGSKCLDAFIVALKQACDGHGKRWYVSTLELQLVSLELCGPCRSAQLLDVRVDEHTPPTLWTSRTPHTTPSQSSPDFDTSNRVPAVQPFGWTWKLPRKRLPQRAAFELKTGPEHQRQHGDSRAASGGSVVWPKSLKRLVFPDIPIHEVSWPASLKELSFGTSFNQLIVGATWPASMLQLSFGFDFNQPVFGVMWPASLQRLLFGTSFNQPIVEATWPASLQQLSFGYFFNQPIVGATWPASLQQLSFRS